MYILCFRIVNRGHYSEKDAALAVKEMLVGVKVSSLIMSPPLTERQYIMHFVWAQ